MPDFQLCRFAADVTCPLGHPLIAGLRKPAERIADRLEARGFVLLGADDPIVLCAVDWCEIRNLAYERWRLALAEAAGTSPERVLVCCLHQHDAPLSDLGAENLLARVGLGGAMFDYAFHEKTVRSVARAVKQSLRERTPVTHIGTGEAEVERIASNRRVVLPDGRVTFGRGSNSGGRPVYRDAPEGLIDPKLRTLALFNKDRPLLAVSAYATHPMSYYGRGEVSADFVGMARREQQRRYPHVHQIYLSGAAGDVTAGKYNDGSPANRPLLAHRLAAAMDAAWKSLTPAPLDALTFRLTQVDFEFRRGEAFTAEGLWRTLENAKAAQSERILAAMGLASRQRTAENHPIDVPCLELGPARLLLLPAESFVAYQLMAQEIGGDAFVVTAGYGECWPGYIPTEAAFADGFTDKWLWVAPGAEPRMREALKRVLTPEQRKDS